MPICPGCGSEFESGVLRCPDCDVALTSEAPGERPAAPARDRERQASLVVAYVAADEVEAEMISDLLEDAGIANSIFEDTLLGVASENFGAPARGPRVEVFEKDLAEARRLIAEFKRSGPAEEVEEDESP